MHVVCSPLPPHAASFSLCRHWHACIVLGSAGWRVCCRIRLLYFISPLPRTSSYLLYFLKSPPPYPHPLAHGGLALTLASTPLYQIIVSLSLSMSIINSLSCRGDTTLHLSLSKQLVSLSGLLCETTALTLFSFQVITS
jgi:hypothetical protein